MSVNDYGLPLEDFVLVSKFKALLSRVPSATSLEILDDCDGLVFSRAIVEAAQGDSKDD